LRKNNHLKYKRYKKIEEIKEFLELVLENYGKKDDSIVNYYGKRYILDLLDTNEKIEGKIKKLINYINIQYKYDANNVKTINKLLNEIIKNSTKIKKLDTKINSDKYKYINDCNNLNKYLKQLKHQVNKLITVIKLI